MNLCGKYNRVKITACKILNYDYYVQNNQKLICINNNNNNRSIKYICCFNIYEQEKGGGIFKREYVLFIYIYRKREIIKCYDSGVHILIYTYFALLI